MWFVFFVFVALTTGILACFGVVDNVWHWIMPDHAVFAAIELILLIVVWVFVDRAFYCGEIYKEGDKVTGYQYDSGGPRRSHARLIYRVLLFFVIIYALVTIFPEYIMDNRSNFIQQFKGAADPVNELIVGVDSTGVVDPLYVDILETKQKDTIIGAWRWLVLGFCLLGLFTVSESLMSKKAKKNTSTFGKWLRLTAFVVVIGIVAWPMIPGTSGNFPWETNSIVLTDSTQVTTEVPVTTMTVVTDASAVYKLKEEIMVNPQWWRYVITAIYLLTLLVPGIFLVVKKKYKTVGIFLIVGLAAGTILRSLFLPGEVLMMTSNLWSLLLGTGILGHGIWRHKVINHPMDWNVDPEDSDSNAQKNYYGLWGNALFHSLLFLCLGPFKGFMHLWRIPFFWSFLLLIGTIYFLLRKNKKQWEKISIFSRYIWDLFRKMHRSKTGLNLRGLIYQIASSLIVSIILFSFFVLKTSSLLTVIILLPAAFLLGASYEVQIRAMLVPAIQKRPIYNRFLLLGQKYLTNGFWVTLLPAWLWRFKIIAVPFARWELDGIETPYIPTRDPDFAGVEDEKANAGVPVKIIAKALAQCFNPFYFLKMPSEDRATLEATKAVLIRVMFDALRDITRRITYNQAKMQDYYQFAVRRGDLKGYPDNHPLVVKYHKRAIMEIKVKSVDKDGWNEVEGRQHPIVGKYDPTYVGDDEEGIMIPATCSEYVDWKMETSTGCRLLELGIIDVSAEGVEAAELDIAVEERKLKKAKITKKIMKQIGEGEGDRQAAQVRRFLKMILSQDSDQAQMGMDYLVRIVGAEKLGTLFGAAEGGSDLLRQLSAKAGKSTTS